MTKFGKRLLGAAVGVASLAAVSTVANAATLIVGSGWQYGQDNARNVAQTIPITFTVTNLAGDTFSLTDGFAVGDVYKVSFTVPGPFTFGSASTFSLYPTSFNNNLGPYATTFAPDWLSASYSHLQVFLSPGTYTVLVKDQSSVGYPAGFGFRLDEVPEPASWALMLVGFGGLGYALRSRRKLAKARI